MKLSVGEKVVIGIALLAAVFTIGFFAGRSGRETFVVETEKNTAEVSVSDDSGEVADIGAAAEPSSEAEGQNGESGPININTADSELLQTLPGIGEKIAARIMAYREEYGPFEYVDEIMDVSGIGEKIFENIETMITVD